MWSLQQDAEAQLAALRQKEETSQINFEEQEGHIKRLQQENQEAGEKCERLENELVSVRNGLTEWRSLVHVLLASVDSHTPVTISTG